MLAEGKAMHEIPGMVMFDGGPKGVSMHSFFLAPIPVTRDNLNLVIDAGWVSKDVVCQGVAAGTVAACN
jgi:D-xylose transport system substrate-binding protein